ncbi:MAG: 3-methyl-2-oxobutanoate dehydrogenase subunit VorB [Bacteroidales bacterium]|nr:3-methyl-2-oxobutanoate dehydrogenase subunit VorB [Bacteroidales bacterium]
MTDVKLMKGNEALAEAVILSGCDGYFGYPITPQSEIMEYLMAQKTEKRTGMVVLQAESELAAINMVYGGASTGKKVMTSSSGPGISLMQESISYLAGAELPCLIVNVVRGGPGLGTIQPIAGRLFSVGKRGGGHGDYKLIVLAPASVQEMADHVNLAFHLAFKYRNPALILSDGVIGQMMEKVTFAPQLERIDAETLDWPITGDFKQRNRRVITSLELDPLKQEEMNLRLQAKYRDMEQHEIRYEAINCDGHIDFLLVSYGSSARVCAKSIELAAGKGIKVGLVRPVTLFPFPGKPIAELSMGVKGVLTVEMSAGQLIEDVRLAVGNNAPVKHFGRMGA